MYNDFKIKLSSIFSEVKIIKPDVFKDNRGFLFTDYLDSFFKDEFTPSLNFVHSKNAHNNAKVLRGIHGDFDSYKNDNFSNGSNYALGINTLQKGFSISLDYYFYNAKASKDLDDDGIVFSISKKTSF